ncbi:alpha/beta fold hydrolase [Halosimplex halophilum]|uniref:alpha/beta fold hydrolase n=1 Tax=Halosimplex halophilum TaxID=2559572 RepID=UPI00143554B3|nr:alpha/beta hydrolase [Halosimplex halophilum]
MSDSVELETLHLSGPDPAIVFVHGGLGSLWNPYPQLAAFEGEHELVTYSLAGNGNSTARPTQSLAGHVSDLRQLLDELQIDQPIVHGHSYGTAVAIEYAKRHPIAGVVLHAGGDHDLTPAWEKPLLRLFLALRLYRIPVNDALIRQLAYTVGFHEETSPAVVEDFLQSNPLPHRRSAWTTVTEGFWGYDGRSTMDQIDVPTLVIHGPADGIVPVEVGRDTAIRIPKGVFCRVERTGHVAMIERPDAYNTLIRALVTAIRETLNLDAALSSHLECEE